MTFIDTYDGTEYTLRDMWSVWSEVKAEDTENHSTSFMCELFEIIMASINGRNDLDIVGMTPAEIDSFLIALHCALESRGLI